MTDFIKWQIPVTRAMRFASFAQILPLAELRKHLKLYMKYY
jgi:hypothetical protein